MKRLVNRILAVVLTLTMVVTMMPAPGAGQVHAEDQTGRAEQVNAESQPGSTEQVNAESQPGSTKQVNAEDQPGSAKQVNAESQSSNTPATSAAVLDNPAPLDYIDDSKEADNGDNPYGLKKGETGQLVAQNELALIRNDRLLLRKNYADNKRETNPVEGNNIAYDFDNCNPAQYDISSHKIFGGKAIAVKNPYTNIDSILAQVGYKSDGNVYVKTVDLDYGSIHLVKLDYKTPYKTNQRQRFAWTNFMGITAGDYDGDGKESIVVSLSAVQDDHYTKVVFAEYEIIGTSILDLVKTGEIMSERLASTGQDENFICAALTTGDYNGDGIDDLAAVTYCGKQEGHPNATPKIRTALGAEDGSIVDSLVNTSMVESIVQGEAYVPYACGVDSGDVNGDLKDEIVVSGYRARLKFTGSGNADGIDYFPTSDGRMLTGVYFVENDKLKGRLYDHAMNKFTRGGSAGGLWSKDDAWQQCSVTCVAINARPSAEYCFISGTLMDFSKGEARELLTPDYFREVDSGAGGALTGNTYIQAAAAGSFDRNTTGREQICGVIALKDQGSETYRYKLFMISGSGYEDTETSLGLATKYISNDIEADTYLDKNTDNDWDVIPVAADFGERDGMRIRFDSMEYGYSRPQVVGVLQAAPYFSEIGQGSGSCSLTFTETMNELLSETYHHGYGGGFYGNVGAVIFAGSVTIKYNGSYAFNYSHGKSRSYSRTFSAGAYNTVIVKKSPVYIYKYLIEKDGTYDENNFIFKTQVQEPTWYQLSVDEYNSMVDEYNRNTEAFNKTGPDYVEEQPGLTKLEDDYLANNEGNPYGYMSNTIEGYEALNEDSVQLGKNGGSSSLSFSESASESKGNTCSNGVSFDITASWGRTVKAGFAAGYNYSYSEGETQTITKGDSVAGSVSNLSRDMFVKQLDECGYTKATNITDNDINKKVSDMMKPYDFTWEVGKWPSNIKLNDDENDDTMVPIYGYKVWNVSSPAGAPTDLTVEAAKDSATGNQVLNLRWKAGEDDDNINGYNIYRINRAGEYEFIARVSTPQDEDGYCTCTIDKIGGMPVQSNDTADYWIAAVGDFSGGTHRSLANGSDSVISNVVRITTNKAQYQVVYSCEDSSLMDEFSVKYANTDVEIPSGSYVDENNIITIHAKAKEGYSLDSIEVVENKGGGIYEKSYPIPATGREFDYTMPAHSPLEFTVNTPKKCVQGDVVFTLSIEDAGVYTRGDSTVSAMVDEVPISIGQCEINATEESKVVVTAEPDDNHILYGWCIDGGVVQRAFGDSELTFFFTKNDHEIRAIFVEKRNVMKTIIIDEPEGGSIDVSDKDGNKLELVNGRVSVPEGTDVVFSAHTEKGYNFRGWTGDIPSSSKDKEVKVKVLSDLHVGAGFECPIKSSFSYNVNIWPSESGTAADYTVSAYDEKGTYYKQGESYKLPSYKNITVKAFLNNPDYRITGFEVYNGTSRSADWFSEYTRNEEYSFDMSSRHDVTVRIARGNVITFSGMSANSRGYTVQFDSAPTFENEGAGRIWVDSGEEIRFRVNANEGYEKTQSFQVTTSEPGDGGKNKVIDIEPDGDGWYSLNNIDKPMTVSVDGIVPLLSAKVDGTYLDGGEFTAAIRKGDERSGEISGTGTLSGVSRNDRIEIDVKARDGYEFCVDPVLSISDPEAKITGPVKSENGHYKFTVSDFREDLVIAILGQINRNIENSRIYLNESGYEYDEGGVQSVAYVLDEEDHILWEGVDYEEEYENNQNVGVAKVTVKGIGAYSGQITEQFIIKPATVRGVTLTPGKGAFAAKWITSSANNADGYQIRYAVSGDMSDAKSETVSGSGCVISNLTGDRNYYVQMRCYKRVGGETYYSDWSSTETVTTENFVPETPETVTAGKFVPKATKQYKPVASKKAFTVKWKKSASGNCTGYQIRYSTSSRMKKAKTVKVKGYKRTSKKIGKLKARKKYYVQVRVYKTIAGKTYYSKWSAKKSVKTK